IKVNKKQMLRYAQHDKNIAWDMPIIAITLIWYYRTIHRFYYCHSERSEESAALAAIILNSVFLILH
ncbi:MAG: hypothetical protein K2I75_00365, partial [Clostridiales bacterium]|nr:hypothetical protein [Clostridiales bacterium]